MKYGRPIWWKWFLSCEPGPWWQAREYPRCVFITQEWSRWSTIRAESPPSQNKPWLLPSSQLVTGRIHHSNTATKSHTSRISTPISPPQFLFLVLAQWQANMNGQKKNKEYIMRARTMMAGQRVSKMRIHHSRIATKSHSSRISTIPEQTLVAAIVATCNKAYPSLKYGYLEPYEPNLHPHQSATIFCWSWLHDMRVLLVVVYWNGNSAKWGPLTLFHCIIEEISLFYSYAG